MDLFSDNLKFLRQRHQLRQQDLAEKLDVKRSQIGAYEEGRAMPKIPVLQQLAAYFGLTLDELVGKDLKNQEKTIVSGGGLKVLSIVVDANNEELIPIVPVKASAGYLNGYADPEYMGQLPSFYMPVPELSRGKTFRVFQLKGDSMLPVQPGSYVFCEYVESLDELKDGDTYVLITKEEGLVYKRVFRDSSTRLLLKSDNSAYEPYLVEGDSVLEIWKAAGVLSFNLPQPNHLEVSKLSDILAAMKDEIRQLRQA